MSIDLSFSLARQGFQFEVELNLPAHGLTAIVGPSGCGKTTLLRAIAGLERRAEGFLRCRGKVWQDGATFLPPHKRSVGYVFQQPTLFPHLSVSSNLRYGLKRSAKGGGEEALQRAVELLEIAHLLERAPDTLSGGEQQRVAIARALASSPDLLLMDEPLAALDQKRKREIIPYFHSLHRELAIPILYVSHSPDEVMRLADHLVLLEQGRVQAVGPLKTLVHHLLPEKRCEENSLAAYCCGELPGGLYAWQTSFGTLQLPFAPQHGSEVQLLVDAHQSSIHRHQPTAGSAANCFSVVCQRIEDQADDSVCCELLLGSEKIVLQLAPDTTDALGLKQEQRLWLQLVCSALHQPLPPDK